MWGASARAHVHTFERWCLLARSFIADQGVILVLYFGFLPKAAYLIDLAIDLETHALSEIEPPAADFNQTSVFFVPGPAIEVSPFI